MGGGWRWGWGAVEEEERVNVVVRSPRGRDCSHLVWRLSGFTPTLADERTPLRCCCVSELSALFRNKPGASVLLISLSLSVSNTASSSSSSVSVCLSLSACLPVCLSLCWSLFQSMSLSLIQHLPPPPPLSVCLSVSVCLPACLSACLPVCLFLSLSLSKYRVSDDSIVNHFLHDCVAY